MKSIICPNCNLINFVTETVCKRCKKSLADRFEPTESFKESKELGEFEFESNMSVMAKTVLIIAFILLLVTFFFGLVYGKNNGLDDDLKLMLILGGLIPFLCCIGVVSLLRKKKLRIYQNGFVFQNKDKNSIVYWDEVKNCTESIEWILLDGIPLGRGRALIVNTIFEEKMVFGQEIGGLGEIIKLIKRKVLR